MSDHAVVRMYNVGFGDCFLVVLPTDDGPKRILFDCGTHPAGSGPRKLSEVVSDLVADVTDDGKARIDVVVGTHRHADHVSGFQQKAWRQVEVGEVWMPWTEDPDDAEARAIRERQSRAAQRLVAALAARGDQQSLAWGLAANALTNAKAMETLHAGFSGAPGRRFLPTASGSATFTTSVLPGVRIHVLGPSRDPQVIRDMDPPAGAGYLRMAGDNDGDGASREPFDERWSIPVAEYDHAHLALEERDRTYLEDVADADLFGIAVALEKAVNGTSLVLLLELGDAFLLFPGDAQWGTWKAILDDPTRAALVEQTTFWKVGHHGSHNATPKRFVEGLAQKTGGDAAGLWAMVSTRHVEIWPAIPKPELVTAIGGLHGHFARSDRADGSSEVGFDHYDEHVIEARVPVDVDDEPH
jgi:beta-lactamase superfamily II metal-dependent hydrolase